MSDTEIVYRHASVRDVDRVHDLYMALNGGSLNPYTAFEGNEARVRYELTRMRRTLLASDDHACLVADDGSALVGYVSASLERSPSLFATRFYARIDELYVEPDARRQGIGTGLMQSLLRGLRSIGVERVQIATSAATLDAARPFLESLGYGMLTATFDAELLATSRGGEPGHEDAEPASDAES